MKYAANSAMQSAVRILRLHREGFQKDLESEKECGEKAFAFVMHNVRYLDFGSAIATSF